ncbi:phage head morphogenesis protein [Helicobacter pylori]|uniref:phage head morphogenesis protein n=1 Tax=Helicobacter pylori TaxID=210 RepID=UPI002AC79D7A|nr:minor capsid protein [Helicobacter pylori]MDZ5288579.1 minor capsid protein [Helicobacter pylori]
MDYNLAKLTNASSIELPFIAERLSSERAYQKAMRKLMVAIKQAVIDDVLPVYRLYIADGITDLLGGFVAKVKRAVDSAVGWVTGFVHDETDWHTDKFAQSVKTATGADVKPIIASAGDIKTAIIERNVSLISNLADDTRQKIVQAVINANINKHSVSQLKAAIEQILGTQAARADLIAQDQTIKLVADLNRYRQEQAGIKRYKWVSKQDDRVRPLHRQLNGKIYEWGKPTGAEHGLPPGQPIRCRCRAKAVI